MAAAFNYRSSSTDANPSYGARNAGGSEQLSLSESAKRGRTESHPLPPRHKSRISFTLEEAIEYELKHGRKVDPNMDMRYLRRTISNRLSALRSRLRKSKYTKDMEMMVKDLQDKIAGLTPQIMLMEEKRKQLMAENLALRQRIEISLNEGRISDILIDQKQLEVCRLKDEYEAASRRRSFYNINVGNEVMQDFPTVNQLPAPPPPQPPAYSLEFYQNGLLNLQANQQQRQYLGQPSSSSVQVQMQANQQRQLGQPSSSSVQVQANQQMQYFGQPSSSSVPVPVQVQANQQRQLGQQSSSWAQVQPEPEPPTVVENEEEDINVDQYLNLDELYLAP